MRYIRIQKLVKRVCDEDVSDLKIIAELLRTVKEKELFCSIVLEKNYYINYHPKVRIISVSDKKFAYRCFSNKATMKDETEIEYLKELKVETEIEKMIEKHGKDNRWMLLDLEDEDEKD